MGRYERERELQAAVEDTVRVAVPEVEVLDLELNEPRETVRIFIRHDDGVSLEHCTQVTHAVRDLTDHALEVSSPGDRRPLRHPHHFREALGRAARIRVRGGHRAFLAEILEVGDNAVRVRAGDGTESEINIADIVRAALEPAGSSDQEGSS